MKTPPAAAGASPSRQQNRSRTFRMGRDKRKGGSIVEYAITLAIMCAAIFFALNLLGFAASGTFKQTSLAMAAPESSATQAQNSTAMADIAAQTKPYYASNWSWIAIASVFISGLISLGLIRFKKTKKEEAPSPVESPLVQDLKRHREAIQRKRQQIFDIFSSGDMNSLLEKRIEVRHLMSQCIVAVLPDTSRNEIENHIAKKRLRHLLVCNEEKELVGIISDRDLQRKHAKTAAEIMTIRPKTTQPDVDISSAMSIMINKHISCLPVVEDDCLLGVVTTTDLMLALQCVTQILQKIAIEIQTAPESISTGETSAAQSGYALSGSSR